MRGAEAGRACTDAANQGSQNSSSHVAHLHYANPLLVLPILIPERTRVCTNRHGGGVFAQADYSGYTEVVFNELEAGCFPLTGPDEWLINQTALLSSSATPPLSPISLTSSQLCTYRYINGVKNLSHDDTDVTPTPRHKCKL